MKQKTYTVTGYQAFGTRDPNCYFVDVAYRGRVVKRFDGTVAFENALRYVSRNGGRAIIFMGPSA